MLGGTVQNLRNLRYRLFKQPEGELHGQNLAGGLVDAGLRNPAGFHGCDHSLEIFITLHVHVNTRFHGNHECLGRVRYPMMHGMKPLNVHPVTDHESVESQFITKQIIEQPLVTVAWNPVDLVMCRHHRPYFSVTDRRHKRRQIKLTQLALGDVHRRRVQSAGRLATGDQMLGASHHVIP